MDDSLRPDAARSFYLLAASLPFVLGTLGFRGLFEAHQHFGLATALRTPFALFNFVAPLLVLPFSNSLTAIVGVLVLGRLVTWGAHVYFGLRRYPWLRLVKPSDSAAIVPLLKIGGWMTVSNVISPLMVNVDRFLIGAMLSMTAVAFYVTPYELVTKLLFVPAAVLGVFFPAFAATFVQDRKRTAQMLDRATRLLLIAVFPPVLMLVGFAHEGLLLWVGADFAREGTVVLQVIAIGVFINSLGQVPFALLQATGRPDLTAKLSLVELPIYVALIYLFAARFGVPGVAMAWTARVAIDTCALCWMTRAQLAEGMPALERALLRVGALSFILAALCVPSTVGVRAVGVALVAALFGVAVWRCVLEPAERQAAVDFLRFLRRRVAET